MEQRLPMLLQLQLYRPPVHLIMQKRQSLLTAPSSSCHPHLSHMMEVPRQHQLQTHDRAPPRQHPP